jgi:hypothetical protein
VHSGTTALHAKPSFSSWTAAFVEHSSSFTSVVPASSAEYEQKGLAPVQALSPTAVNTQLSPDGQLASTGSDTKAAMAAQSKLLSPSLSVD